MPPAGDQVFIDTWVYGGTFYIRTTIYIYVSFIPQAVYLLYDKPLTVVKVGLAPSGDPPNLAF